MTYLDPRIALLSSCATCVPSLDAINMTAVKFSPVVTVKIPCKFASSLAATICPLQKSLALHFIGTCAPSNHIIAAPVKRPQLCGFRCDLMPFASSIVAIICSLQDPIHCRALYFVATDFPSTCTVKNAASRNQLYGFFFALLNFGSSVATICSPQKSMPFPMLHFIGQLSFQSG